MAAAYCFGPAAFWPRLSRLSACSIILSCGGCASFCELVEVASSPGIGEPSQCAAVQIMLMRATPRWIVTVLPGRSVSIRDAAAYGLIVVQGWGRIGKLAAETPALIRYGQMTDDELFVSEDAARAGIRIENPSDTDPLVVLKHFGPGNPDAERLRR